MTERDLQAEIDSLTTRVASLERRLARERTERALTERQLEMTKEELETLNSQLLELNCELEEKVRRNAQALLEARAETRTLLSVDQLTGLPNRAAFADALDREIKRAAEENGRVVLVLVDLDRFKKINDTMGQAAGDMALAIVAERLESAAWPGSVVARLGADEFGVVIPVAGPSSDALAIEKRFAHLLDEPLCIDGLKVPAGCSLGIATFPDHARHATGLQRCADLALHQVKQSQPGGVQCFEPAMLRHADIRHRLEQDLRSPEIARQLRPWFQLIMPLHGRARMSIEALARWHHPELGIVPTDLFISIAEERGLIGVIGHTILTNACQTARPWIAHGLIEEVCVNISPCQLDDPTIADQIKKALAQARLEPSRLVLEITENVLVGDMEAAGDLMRSLSAIGVRFALDDFGSGYSNLSYLHRLPFSKIKLDRALSHDVTASAPARAIISGVVSIAKDLGLVVVAEGVETAQDSATLRRLGCDLAQGFLYSRPQPAEKLEAYLTSLPAHQLRKPARPRSRADRVAAARKPKPTMRRLARIER